MSMARRLIGSVFIVGYLIVPSLVFADCIEPRWSDAMIAKIERDPVLDDGRLIRLAGLTPPLNLKLITLGPLKVSVVTRMPDRWGRVSAFIAPLQSSLRESFNVSLVRAGAALAVPGEWPSGCFALAHAAEADARQARRGIWAQPPVITADDLDALKDRVGRFTIVEGQVRSVRQGRRQIFLNFGAFGRERLNVSVTLSRLEAFKAAGRDLLALRGQFVSLRGVVGPGPSMELNVPEALSVASHE